MIKDLISKMKECLDWFDSYLPWVKPITSILRNYPKTVVVVWIIITIIQYVVIGWYLAE